MSEVEQAPPPEPEPRAFTDAQVEAADKLAGILAAAVDAFTQDGKVAILALALTLADVGDRCGLEVEHTKRIVCEILGAVECTDAIEADATEVAK